MKKEHLPDHVKKDFPTIHAWRMHKRKEARAVVKAIRALHTGCAFTPARGIGILYREAEEVVEALSVKNWGR